MKTTRNAGFTVIELIVAVTIVCLLVAVAIASFQDHMTRKARVQAKQAMIDAAEWLRHQHTTSGTYLVKLPITQAPGEGDAAYRIHLLSEPVTASDPNSIFPATSASSYTVLAVPVDADACGTLMLDSAGRTGVLGKGALVADCWR